MPKEYKVFINDRNYTSWVFHDLETNTDLPPDKHDNLNMINPIQNKLFTGDIIQEDGSLIYSSIRNCSHLAGVLILEKTYGRTENKKRLLYKCIPHDKRIPFFLVPYDIKLGFQKNLVNKYIVFRYDNWETQFPRGIIQEVLGDVDNLEVFYEYQLYCRSLHDSMREFTKKTRYLKNNDDNIKKILNNPAFTIEQRLDEYIFTIDSQSSTDLDDGFSVVKINDNLNRLSVYISNVFFWMETFDMWGSFSERVATIYLPNYKRPLLPTILSNELCSLLENQKRFAFVMDIYLDNSGNIQKHEFKNALIMVKKNWCYEDPKMVVKDKNYNLFFNIFQKNKIFFF
jgi:exoribonuclease R